MPELRQGFQTMPTVAIDYTPAIRQRAGIGRIVRGQIQALVESEPRFDLRLFVNGRIGSGEGADTPLPLHATPLNERAMTRLWHRLNLPVPRVEWFTGGPLDLFHATDFVLAPSSARRKVVTVHDLAFLFYPDAAMPSLHRYLNVVVPRSVRRADHILADSQHTARDLQARWQIADERITVVQGAVDHAHFYPRTDRARRLATRRRYGIGMGPFLFTLSTLEPRKNHVRLIRAFHQARREADVPQHLVIGGAKGWLYDEIFATVQQLGLDDEVHFAGYVDEADLPVLYSAADFFVFPSLYEGFGLPLIEALACGTPVLTADNSCLPEAAGPGAVYVDAKDVTSIAQGIVRLANDADLRKRLSRAGRAHAASFTWTRSAQQLAAAYQTVLAA